jgi:hypothetical protein
MNIRELIKRISLIVSFTDKMSKEAVPYSSQKIFIKLYASELNFNLNDIMVENICRPLNNL